MDTLQNACSVEAVTVRTVKHGATLRNGVHGSFIVTAADLARESSRERFQFVLCPKSQSLLCPL
eukprot:2161129-Prorocentrum_lima.AAC.1